MARVRLALLLCALLVVSAAAKDVATALAEINAQISASLSESSAASSSSLPSLSLTGAAPSIVDPPLGSPYAPVEARFKATTQETVAALNSLDMKSALANTIGAGEGSSGSSLAVNSDMPPPAVHERPAVAAYASIALETVQRAQGALAFLKVNHVRLTEQVKMEQANFEQWMKEQRQLAENRITSEIEHVGQLTDEVAHLEHVYADALAKERSYQTQLNQMVSERQLQTQPPMMPVVAAAALSEDQYKTAVDRLSQFRTKALQVMQQTTEALNARKQLIIQGTDWIKNSKEVLTNWLASQQKALAQHEADGQKAVDASAKRVAAVEKILAQAVKAHEDYLNALRRLDVEARMKELADVKAKQDALKPADAYEEVRVKSYSAALQLEIDNLKNRLATIPGDGKTSAPPAIWGVLSQYHGFAVPVPHIITPTAENGDLVYDTSMGYHEGFQANIARPPPVPSTPEALATVPTLAEADGVSPIDDSDLLYSSRPNPNLAPTAASAGEGVSPTAVAEAYAAGNVTPLDTIPAAVNPGSSASASASASSLLEIPKVGPLVLHAMPPPPSMPVFPPVPTL